MEDHVIKDTGFKSRKLVVVILAHILVLLGGILSAKWPSFAPSYETFVGGTIAIASMYVVGNVSSTFLNGKINASVTTARINKDAPKEENKEVKEES